MGCVWHVRRVFVILGIRCSYPTTHTIAPVRDQHRRRTWVLRTVRQHMHRQRQLPPNLQRTSMAIQEAAARAASYCLSKGRSTAGVDEQFIHMLNRVHNNHTATANNTQSRTHNQHIRFPQEREHKKRRKQRATIIRRMDQPQMLILRTIEPGSIEKWRLALADFIAQARQYQQQSNPGYRIRIKRWVDLNVWNYISMRLLRQKDRTKRGHRTNDAAIVHYLLHLQQYAHQAHTARPASSSSQTNTIQPSEAVQQVIAKAYHDGMFVHDSSDHHDESDNNDRT